MWGARYNYRRVLGEEFEKRLYAGVEHAYHCPLEYTQGSPTTKRVGALYNKKFKNTTCM